ncbi:hypothetical protein J2R78_006639 [Bradyrhizobium sp. USDA 4538]|nr:hypothetical protein [Bradyrhizobium sp. USDA 4538]
MTEAFDGRQNLVSGLGPFEWLRVFVVEFDEGADVGLELPDGGMNTSLDLLSGEFGKPALNLVDPGRGSRRESQRQRARDMAGKAIDKIADSTASSDEQADRKRQFVKGPGEFQKLRRDRNRK